jgi:hypothetical protein
VSPNGRGSHWRLGKLWREDFLDRPLGVLRRLEDFPAAAEGLVDPDQRGGRGGLALGVFALVQRQTRVSWYFGSKYPSNKAQIVHILREDKFPARVFMLL